jgi:hypothetical protein
MVETESFIKEVSEEVRKDRLFKALKRFQWVILSLFLGIILIVSGYEYYKFNKKTQSEANGEFLYKYIKSLEEGLVPESLPAPNSYIKTLTMLNQAKYFEKNKEYSLAEKTYNEIINDENSDLFFKNYSMFLLYLLSPAKSVDDKEKIKLLDQLSAPDAPMKLLALEQKLILFLKLDDMEKIKSHVSLITENPQVTQEQLERIQEVKELYALD